MKIAVLLSGGVDSSVALHLLKRDKKNEITAFYLKIWLEDELAFLGDCPWETDLKFAREVCSNIGAPLEILPFQSQYQNAIVDYTLSELRAGRTPSPDILCNQNIKFGEFYQEIDDAYSKVATGHYAQIDENDGVYMLKCCPDSVKDQTYFLSSLNQNQLSRALFPIGSMLKEDVRSLARELDLPNQDRKDSQGLCFLGKIKYNEFVKFHLGNQIGDIIEIESDRILGNHNGYWYYTIGQRQGLGLSGGPWYVVRKDIENNVIYVSHQENFVDKARNEFYVRNVHWIAGEPKRANLKLKLRHGPEFIDCIIEPDHDHHRFLVKMTKEDSGVASGQSAIFYENNYCLGRGIIE